MIRIAMLSFAHVHALGYALQIRERPDAEFACVWDDDVERGESAARHYGVPFVADLDAVLGNPAVDAVVIDAETSKHTDLILRSVAAGKHVFTEKALTLTTADADRVVEAVRASGIKFMISFPFRSLPDVRFAKRMVEEGALGQVTFLRARIAHASALEDWFWGGMPRWPGYPVLGGSAARWFGDPELAGGGALFDLGCHNLDLMLWFLGRPKSVTAHVSNVSGRYPVDDNAVVVAEFESGALAVLDVSRVHRMGPTFMEIYGTEGCLIRGLPDVPVRMESRIREIPGGRADLGAAELGPGLPTPLDQWISALQNGTPLTITVEDGRDLTELLEAAYTSAREGRRVELSAGG